MSGDEFSLQLLSQADVFLFKSHLSSHKYLNIILNSLRFSQLLEQILNLFLLKTYGFVACVDLDLQVLHLFKEFQQFFIFLTHLQVHFHDLFLKSVLHLKKILCLITAEISFVSINIFEITQVLIKSRVALAFSCHIIDVKDFFFLVLP